MDHKELLKLAATCRKAGIKHFKNEELEFTLTDEAPASNYKRRSSKKLLSGLPSTIAQDIVSENAITDEEMLFWSSNPESEQGPQ